MAEQARPRRRRAVRPDRRLRHAQDREQPLVQAVPREREARAGVGVAQQEQAARPQRVSGARELLL
jgi:hypothetical protein